MTRFEPWTSLIAAAVLSAIFLIIWQSQLVAPSTPAGTGFEQEKAFTTLSRLLKEERPHIAGSPENKVVRDRIVEELKSYGYTPEIQTAFQCAPPDRFPGCTQVENIIAVHSGTDSCYGVLVTAHYDSVAAGPGVADDGAGVAVVLELARVLANRKTQNTIVLLITDGEETGLRGALAFAQRHPLMPRANIQTGDMAKVVVNAEARGASGPSMMFETGPSNEPLITLFAKTVKHPSANSLTYEIYKLLPNDTDFTVYRATGLTGYNFAFSNSASLYHSERDNLANLDRNSLQHHGDNVFATTFGLAKLCNADLKAPVGSSSYFDLFGQKLIHWPDLFNVPITVIAFLAILGLIILHRSSFSLKGAGYALIVVIAVPILLFAAGWLLSYPLGIWPGVHPIDHPEPWPGRIATTAAALFVAAFIAIPARRLDQRVLLLGAWAVLALLAIIVAVYVTGAAFLLMWPALGFAIAGWIETFTRKSSLKITGWVGFALIAFMWLPYLLALELVLGFDLTEYKILTLVPVVLALTPVFAPSMRWVAVAAPLLVAAIAAAVASQTPAYAENHPRGQNIVYYDDRTAAQGPRWLVNFVGQPDEAYMKANGFPDQPEAYKPFGLLAETKERFKPAADLKLAAPTLQITGASMVNEHRVINATLRGGRGGLQLAIGFVSNAGVRSLVVEGEEVVGEARFRKDAPVIARILGLGERDIPVQIKFDANGPPPALILVERSPLPDGDEPRELKGSRAKDAAPVHSGDNALVMVKVDLTVPPPAPIP